MHRIHAPPTSALRDAAAAADDDDDDDALAEGDDGDGIGDRLEQEVLLVFDIARLLADSDDEAAEPTPTLP